MLEFVTSVSQTYHRYYGHRLCKTFLEYIPQPASLNVYCDGSLDVNKQEPFEAYGDGHPAGIIRLRDLGWVNGARAFIETAERRMIEKMGGAILSNDPDQRMMFKRYDYRWDVVKFGKKGLSLTDALNVSESRYLFWLDADVIIKQRLSHDILLGLFDGHGICCFQREWPHTEAGFIGFDLEAPGVDVFKREYTSYWHEQRVFNFTSGWTDCHVLDASIVTATNHGLRVRNLSTAPRGHVMAISTLGRYLDHQKGKRRFNQKDQ